MNMKNCRNCDLYKFQVDMYKGVCVALDGWYERISSLKAPLSSNVRRI